MSSSEDEDFGRWEEKYGADPFGPKRGKKIRQKPKEEKFVPLVKKPPKVEKMAPRRTGKDAPNWISKGVTKKVQREALQEDLRRIEEMNVEELRAAIAQWHEDPGKLKAPGLRKKLRKIIREVARENNEALGRRTKGLATEKTKGLVQYRKADGSIVYVTPKQKAVWRAKRIEGKKSGKGRVKKDTIDYETNDGKIIQRTPAQIDFLERQKARKGTGAGRKPRGNRPPLPPGKGDASARAYAATLLPKQRMPWAYFYGSTYTDRSKVPTDPDSRAKFAAKKRREFKSVKKYKEGLKEKQD